MRHKLAADITRLAHANALLLNGTSGNDLLTGSDLADSLSGLDGDDTINGLGGNDTLSGGNGRDQIYGGAGDNTLYGGADGDVIHIDELTDFGPLLGGADLIHGGTGNDVLDGGIGNDSIYGGDGNDMILDFGGMANSWGGKGDDLIIGGAGTLRGEDGNDTVQGQLAYGGIGNDSVLGDALASVLLGEAGNDILTALATGNDTLTGGKGSDAFVFFNSDRGVDRVTDFKVGVDSLNLADFGVTQANLASVATQVGRDVQIHVDTADGLGLTVVLVNVNLGLLLA